MNILTRKATGRDRFVQVMSTLTLCLVLVTVVLCAVPDGLL